MAIRRCVAREFATQGIRALSISPGPIRTPFQAAAQSSPELVQRFYQLVPVAPDRAFALLDGTLLGTAQLVLDMPPNQPHRADVAKLLVDPAARRAGLGRALMLRLEAEARRHGRRLLVLDTLAGDAGERLYRATGWNEVGAIPGFALDEHGAEHATILFWKRV